MIAYKIETALESKFIKNVIVSNDCKEIENVTKKFGAKSYFLRPKDLALDNSKVIDNYLYTINRLNNEFEYNAKSFIVLQPTSPLRTIEDIYGAIELLNYKKADSVISYTEEYCPIN